MGDPSRDLERQDDTMSSSSTQDHHPHNSLKTTLVTLLRVEEGEVYHSEPEKNPGWYQRLLDAGVEENGINPVPLEERTSTQYGNLFTVFFTCLLCLLPIPTGMLATLGMGLSLRDASLVIIFFAMLTCIPPAFMGIGGMETGLRQLVQARYSFGGHLVLLPLLLNAATATGFSLVSTIVGGQTISSLNPGSVSVNIGIVIVCLVSFLVSLLGFKAVHFWERWAWIPSLIGIVIAVGCGGKYLHLQQQKTEPATVQQIMTYGCLIAGYFITFGGTVSDYSIYHCPRGVSKIKIFLYMYLGFLLPSIPLLTLGAAIGGAVPNVPSWSSAYEVTGIGGVMHEMLAPAGRFGDFVVVVLALSVIGNVACSMYSVSINLQQLLPFFAKIHRLFWVVVTMGIMIPFAIKAAEQWEESMVNFLVVIGYWAGCFDAVLICELVVFRRLDYASYDHAVWNVTKRLPPGLAAMGASLVSVPLVVVGMAAPWYTGPVAKITGDIGFESAILVTGLAYIPLRWLEMKWFGR
ncbi:hypothetical protein QBC35DRAFT_510971 [Podospora australis]|uniref:Purine-cytosine permease n=1 Tax=Podospora australis TaxID=1536484 RepID=A0AAN6X4J8_9PEZI|nr:hypothetical protein QBC35DRAFT_510971 [Podospora australis]